MTENSGPSKTARLFLVQKASFLMQFGHPELIAYFIDKKIKKIVQIVTHSYFMFD